MNFYELVIFPRGVGKTAQGEPTRAAHEHVAYVKDLKTTLNWVERAPSSELIERGYYIRTFVPDGPTNTELEELIKEMNSSI